MPLFLTAGLKCRMFFKFRDTICLKNTACVRVHFVCDPLIRVLKAVRTQLQTRSSELRRYGVEGVLIEMVPVFPNRASMSACVQRSADSRLSGRIFEDIQRTMVMCFYVRVLETISMKKC